MKYTLTKFQKKFFNHYNVIIKFDICIINKIKIKLNSKTIVFNDLL